jgi:dTDP-4-dehydrorhamnose 3,5-epimerase
MIHEKTNIKDCYVIKPKLFKDSRGTFFESFKDSEYYTIFGSRDFCQDNISISTKNVLRGLHFQKGDYSQAKLVKVLKGSVQDVVVDCRKGSETYGEVFSYILNGETYEQLFVPRGCAHGFLTLEDDTIFSYKVDNIYDQKNESGIFYNDPDLKIRWKIKKDDFLVISKKDTELPMWKDSYKFNFTYG